MDRPGQLCRRGVRVGAGTYVGPGCVILDDAQIGADCRLVAQVTICHGARIGRRGVFAPGVVIGADGFGHAPDRDGYVKIPQVGTVVIGDDVDVGANTTIDRGTIGDTVIEDGVKIDNLVMVAHNVRIGAHTVIAAMVGIAGSATIGRRCMLAWDRSGIVGHLSICDDVRVDGQDDGQPLDHESRRVFGKPAGRRGRAAFGATARASRSLTSWRGGCAGSEGGPAEQTKEGSDE